MAPKVTNYETVSFGDSSLYTGSSNVPDGDYALKFSNIIDRGKEGKGVERLAVKVEFYPLPFEEGAKVYEHTYGYGKKAHLAMRPHPEDPNMLVRIPDGPTPTFNNQTKWFIFKDSMHQAGLEQGILTDTFETINGVHAHIAAQPAPKEWAEMNKNSDLAGDGEAQASTRGPSMIPVVSMFLDNGLPWVEDGGGLPDVEAPAARTNGAKPVAAKAPVKAASKANGKAKATEDVAEVAKLAVSAVMGVKANEAGCSKAALKTGSFAWIEKNYDADTAQKFMDEVAEDNDALGQILSEYGYEIKGLKITVAA